MNSSVKQKRFDFIIVGQGICGTFLSYYLLQKGKSVLVIDAPKPNTASKVASGVINPVTGRRIVRTWMIETLMPFAVEAYETIGRQLSIDIIQQKNIIDFHATPQMQLAFNERLLQENEYLHTYSNEQNLRPYFNYNFGIGMIQPCYLISLAQLLLSWQQYLQQQYILLEEELQFSNLIISENEVLYKDFTADSILFTDGCNGTENPYFHMLPFAKNKGEAVIVSIPDLPENYMYKQGLSLVHWKNDLWWIGSTYEWNYTDILPTVAFRKKVEDVLKFWLKIPYEIVDHIASERPANIERRPFVGMHPIYKNVGILNGMGTKGCSLAPYFANELAEHLIHKKEIHSLADIQRFSKILSR